MRCVVLIGIAITMGGCFHVIPTFDASDGKSRLIEAKHRAIISVKRPLIGSDGRPVLDERRKQVTSLAVCAEPSPDALQATVVALKKKLPAEAVKALFSFEKSEIPEYVGLRTQTIQLLRDAYFRLCEAFLNDGVDAIAYDVLQRRFQRQIVALLAVEQLTGAVTAGRGTATRSSTTAATDVAKAIEESEQILLDLEKKKEAEKDLAELKAHGEAKETAIEATKRRIAVIQGQIERRQHLIIKLLEAEFVRTTQGTQNSNAEDSSKDTDRRSASAEVANAVRAITLNAINQDYESQVCFETLRFHNNSSQFRNDVNNAFDSAGLEKDLKEDVFMDHCRNLFASQAAFHSARVSVVEAYASAIERVTEGMLSGDGKLSAKDAADYIRMLADSVPTEPGAVFLPRTHGMNGTRIPQASDGQQ